MNHPNSLLRNSFFLTLWTSFWCGISLLRAQHPEALTLEAAVATPEGLLVLCSGLALYLLGLILRPTLGVRWTIFAGAIAVLLLLLTPPTLSSDVYLYALRGRLQTIYNANPYLTAPIAFPQDLFFPYIYSGWLGRLEPYGPLWSFIQAIVSAAGSEEVNAVIFRFKLMGTLGFLLTAYLVWTYPNAAAEPERQRRLYLALCNPVLLIEFVNNAHNDIWMVVFILASLHAAKRGYAFWSLPLITLGVAIKYSALAIVPFTAWFLVRNRQLSPQKLALSTASAFITFAALLRPYYTGPEFFTGLSEVSGIDPLHRSFYGAQIIAAALLYDFAHTVPGMAWLAPASAHHALFFGRLLLLPVLGLILIRTKQLSLGAERSLIAATLLASAVYLPWYSTWWLPLTMLRSKPLWTLFWTAVSSLAYYLGYSTALSLFSLIILSALIYACYSFLREQPNRSRRVIEQGTA